MLPGVAWSPGHDHIPPYIMQVKIRDKKGKQLRGIEMVSKTRPDVYMVLEYYGFRLTGLLTGVDPENMTRGRRIVAGDQKTGPTC